MNAFTTWLQLARSLPKTFNCLCYARKKKKNRFNRSNFFTVVEFRTADHAWWNTNRLATVACLLKKNCLDGR